MTHYEKACAAACKWCAEGTYLRKEGNKPRHQVLREDLGYDLPECNAPTLAEFAEQMAEERERLAEQVKELTEDYNHNRQTLRSFLTDEENLRYAGTLDKLRFLGDTARRAEKAEARVHKLEWAIEASLPYVPHQKSCSIHIGKSCSCIVFVLSEAIRKVMGRSGPVEET